MDTEVLEVLKEIRDETKATNSRLDQTNSRLDQTIERLESLEERVDERLGNVETRLRFVEKGVKNGFSELTQKIALVAKRQLKAEMHIGAELVSISTLLKVGTAQRKADRTVLHDHEKRISTLEKRRRKPGNE